MSETYQKLAESIAIYKPNKNTRVWWIRARIDKKEIRKSTKQRDKDQAIKTAWAMFSAFEERKNKGLLLVSSNTINSLSSGILEKIDEKGSSFDQRKIFNDVILKEWGTKNVEDLTSKDVDVLYRKYEVSGTAKENYYKMTLKTMFDFLILNDIVKRGYLPELPQTKQREKESFNILTASELKATLKHFEDLAEFYSNEYKKSGTIKNKRLFETHKITSVYLQLLAETGARAGKELLNLRLSDIEFTNENLSGSIAFPIYGMNIHIKNGKMSKRSGARRIPAPKYFGMELHFLILSIHGKRIEEMKESGEDMFIFSQPHKPEKPVFVEKIIRENFQLLKEKRLIEPNKKIAPYSFRHTFITHALCQGIDIFLLSELCGNSVSEIQKTYSRFSAVHRNLEVYKIDIFNDGINIST